jgi:hypothetical protein
MRTFLACSGVDGRAEAIDRLEELVRQRSPGAILFAGGLFDPAPAQESLTATTDRRHHDMLLLERFFAALGAMQTVAMVIPGPHDVPLRAFLMAGMNARSQSPGVHLVHCTIVSARDIVISGVGGELTHSEDCGEPTVRCSRTTAEYFLQAFGSADESEKVLLLGSAPNGSLSGVTGNAIAGEIVDSYHPRLCVCGGPTDHRGIDRVAKTTIVNPGRLSDGCAAWIDWSRDTDEQVEMI